MAFTNRVVPVSEHYKPIRIHLLCRIKYYQSPSDPSHILVFSVGVIPEGTCPVHQEIIYERSVDWYGPLGYGDNAIHVIAFFVMYAMPMHSSAA